MPTVTSLRAVGSERVAVELDGEPWRTLPARAVARAGLSIGMQLDRGTLRVVRRELRQTEALCRATQALASRELSLRMLDERLERAAVPSAARAAAIATLEESRLVNDGRFARTRAEALAARGHGDAAIRADLDRAGLDAEVREAALAVLPPEPERAAEIVSRRGRGGRTARFLAGKGFGAEAIEAALGADFGADPDRDFAPDP